jgi:hypothetical protein
MAYLFHDAMFPDAAELCDERMPATLSPIEARVVELALSDGASTLATARWRQVTAALLGLRPAKPLASPRLEALRRFVVAVRHAPARAAKEMSVLLGLGYSPEQLCAVREQVARGA